MICLPLSAHTVDAQVRRKIRPKIARKKLLFVIMCTPPLHTLLTE
jgi:hypothetical protein